MRKALPPLLVIALATTACMTPEQKLVGKWKGKIELGQPLKSGMGSMASGFASMVAPQLNLRPDKSFTLAISIAPIDGTWNLEGQQLILKPKKMMGMTPDQVRDQAKKGMAKAEENMPFPLPFASGNGLPMLDEMRATVNEKEDEITLDPGSGTFLAGFGKMTFTKT